MYVICGEDSEEDDGFVELANRTGLVLWDWISADPVFYHAGPAQPYKTFAPIM